MWRLALVLVLLGWNGSRVLADGLPRDKAFDKDVAGATGVQRLLRGLHFITLTHAANERESETCDATRDHAEVLPKGWPQPPEAHQSTKAQEEMWHLIAGDKTLPPYYLNVKSGEAKWVPGKWRRRRSSAVVPNDVIVSQVPDVSFSDSRTPSAEENYHPMLALLTEMHIHGSKEWTSPSSGRSSSISCAATRGVRLCGAGLSADRAIDGSAWGTLDGGSSTHLYRQGNVKTVDKPGKCCAVPSSWVLPVTRQVDRGSSYAAESAEVPNPFKMLLFVFATAAAVAFGFRRALKPQPEPIQEPEPAGPPDALLCPISLELMVDPVTVAETGQTYECATIKSWFYTHSTDPITNAELRSKKLVPNNAIRKITKTIGEQAPTDTPDWLLCPISLELMVDPVLVVETGQTYDRATIESWLHSHSTDPITNIELRSKKLVPNIAIRKLVLAWQAEHPDQEVQTAAVPPSTQRPSSRSAWIAAIGGGTRKAMPRSESADQLLIHLDSSSPTGGMPRRKVRSFTDLVGLHTSLGTTTGGPPAH